MKDIITFNTEDSLKNAEVGPIRTKTFNLVSENDPVLSEVIPEFNFDNPPVNANELASMLVETCIENKGIGLSANQCGLKHRVFVMGAGDNYVAFFNPKIISQSNNTVHMIEGCLSFPLLSLRISRPETIEVEYQDFNGVKRTTTFNGLSARCFQHELDHMNGIVYTKRVKPVALEMGVKKRKKLFNKVVKKPIDKLYK